MQCTSAIGFYKPWSKDELKEARSKEPAASATPEEHDASCVTDVHVSAGILLYIMLPVLLQVTPLCCNYVAYQVHNHFRRAVRGCRLHAHASTTTTRNQPTVKVVQSQHGQHSMSQPEFSMWQLGNTPLCRKDSTITLQGRTSSSSSKAGRQRQTSWGVLLLPYETAADARQQHQ
jgi:hypothetical protein